MFDVGLKSRDGERLIRLAISLRLKSLGPMMRFFSSVKSTME